MRGELERGPLGAAVSSIADKDATIDPKFAAEFSVEHDA
jgi:hypothetical protein